jgi:Uncharacterized conserved protein
MPDCLLLDTMLGKLATYLRMCGYDTAYALDEGVEADDALLELAAAEGRRLLTRDRALSARAPDAVLLDSQDVEDQLRELADVGFDLALPEEPVRCGVCNATLTRVGTDEPTPDYAPDPAEAAVWRCSDCGQYFWRGSHWDDVAETLADT